MDIMMVKNFSAGVAVLLFVAITARPASALEPPATQPAVKYQLTLHTLTGTEPRQWVFVVAIPSGVMGVTTPQGLMHYIEIVIPAGSTLEWVPGCTVIGGEPMRTKEEIDALADFCKEKKINFVVIPAG